MAEETRPGTDRREFVKRVGVTVAYGAPILVALGAAKPTSSPEKVAKMLQETTRLLDETIRLGYETKFSRADWEMLEPIVVDFQDGLKNWPPKWCPIC